MLYASSRSGLSLFLSRDKIFCIFCFNDLTLLQLWDLTNGTCIRTLTVHQGSIKVRSDREALGDEMIGAMAEGEEW